MRGRSGQHRAGLARRAADLEATPAGAACSAITTSTRCSRARGRVSRRDDRLDALFAAATCDDAAGAPAQPARRSSDLEREIEPRGVWLVHAGLHPRWNDLAALAARLDAQPHDDDWLRGDEIAFMTRVRCCDRFGERVRFTGRPAGRAAAVPTVGRVLHRATI